MKLVLATPSLTHTVVLEYLMSAVATTKHLLDHGVVHEWRNRPGDPFIAKCRSNMVHDFLKDPDATDLLFLDDDLGWPCEKVLEFVQRDEPILCGVYPQKLDELNFPCALMPGDAGLIERDGLVRATHAPTGFMRIKRWVLEKMWDVSPLYRERDYDGITYARRAVFNAGPAQDEQWWGEDYHFCNLATQLGIEIWIDPDIPFYHRGQKRYGARLKDSIPVFREKAKLLIEGKTTSEAA